MRRWDAGDIALVMFTGAVSVFIVCIGIALLVYGP